jgi:hypothetical protein
MMILLLYICQIENITDRSTLQVYQDMTLLTIRKYHVEVKRQWIFMSYFKLLFIFRFLRSCNSAHIKTKVNEESCMYFAYTALPRHTILTKYP